MQQFIPFIVFGVAFVALIAWVMVRGRAGAAKRAAKLQAMGFQACPDEAERLAARIAQLENNKEYRFSVDRPMKNALRGQVVYYYSKSRHRQGSIIAVEEFLFPVERRSRQGLMLFFKPGDLPAGTASHLIGAMATGGWDSQPDDLAELTIPRELQKSNLIGALGPRGTSLYDLIDSSLLDRLQEVGDHGALIVMCRDEWCSLSATSSRMQFDLDPLWIIVQQVARHRALIRTAH